MLGRSTFRAWRFAATAYDDAYGLGGGEQMEGIAAAELQAKEEEMKGQIEGRDGTVYAESTSLYIVPRPHTTPELCDKRVKDFTAPPRAGS